VRASASLHEHPHCFPSFCIGADHHRLRGPFRPALTSAEASNGAVPDAATLDIARGLKHDQARAAFRPCSRPARQADLETPSVDGRPNFMRRSESEPLAKSGRLISVSSDVSRTSPTVFRPAAWQGVLDPGGKKDTFDRHIVRQLGSASDQRTRGRLSNHAYFPWPYPVFMECLLSGFMVHDSLLCFMAPKGFKRGGSAAAGALAFPPPAYPTLPRRGVPPSQGWRTFLRNHADGIAAMDLFVVPQPRSGCSMAC
jgi:hypothetical protein